jgi:predicted nucleic acid-binding protein
MDKRTECYVDTSALIGFLDRSDSYHSLFRQLFSNPPRLVTSSLVVVEGHGWFLRRYDQGRALQFLNLVGEIRPMAVQPFDEEQLAKSVRLLRKLQDQPLTLADAHGLALMNARRITTCWSTDRHLSLTGARLAIEM